MMAMTTSNSMSVKPFLFMISSPVHFATNAALSAKPAPPAQVGYGRPDALQVRLTAR